jgi:hypothetical protein
LKAIRPNPTAVKVKASTSGIRLTFTSSSSSFTLKWSFTECEGELVEEGKCLLPPHNAALDAGGTNAMLPHPNVVMTAPHIVRKKDLILEG